MNLLNNLDKEKKKEIENKNKNTKNKKNKNKNRKRSLRDMDKEINQLKEFENSLPTLDLFSEFNSSSSSDKKKKRRKTKHKKNNNHNKNNKNNIKPTRKNRIPLDALTTSDKFGSFNEEIWLIEEQLIPSKRNGNQTVLWGIYKREKNVVNRIMHEPYDDSEDKEDEDDSDIEIDGVDKIDGEEGSIGLIRLSAKSQYGLGEKYDKKKWYRIRGGQMQIYQGKKNIMLTSASKIERLGKQLPPPPLEELLKHKNIITSVKLIEGVHDKRIEAMWIVAWVRGFQQNQNFILMHLVDGHSRRISARIWNQQKIPDVKIGAKILLTSIKRIPYFTKFHISLQGPLISFESKEHKFSNIDDIDEYQEDLSTINYTEEYHNAIPITIKQIKCDGLNYGDSAFYKCYNISIRYVHSFFKVRDKNDIELAEGWRKNTVIDGKSGKERKVKNSDKITYFINVQIVCNESNITTYLTGFETLGKSIFGGNAKEIYKKWSISDINAAMKSKIAKQKFNLLLSHSKSKKANSNKAYWTIQKLIPPQFDSDYEYYSESEFEEEDDEEEDDYEEDNELEEEVDIDLSEN